MEIVWDFMGVNGISWNSMGFVGIDDGMKWKLSIIIQVLWPFLRFLSIKDMGDMINTWVDWLRRKKLYHLDFWGLWRHRYEWVFLEIGHWGPVGWFRRWPYVNYIRCCDAGWCLVLFSIFWTYPGDPGVMIILKRLNLKPPVTGTGEISQVTPCDTSPMGCSVWCF